MPYIEKDCKEEGCKEKVTYKPKRVFGLSGPPASGEENKEDITVYLTCPNNHNHAYRVTKG